MVLENQQVGFWINRKVDEEESHTNGKFEQQSQGNILWFIQKFGQYLKHPSSLPFSR